MKFVKSIIIQNDFLDNLFLTEIVGFFLEISFRYIVASQNCFRNIM